MRGDDPMWPRLPGEKREIAKIEKTVDLFAEAMKKKLVAKADDGWRGWGDKKNRRLLERKLLNHLLWPGAYNNDSVQGGAFNRSNLVDVADFCMFLWWMQRRTKDASDEG